jgi:virulence-associated protein VapD
MQSDESILYNYYYSNAIKKYEHLQNMLTQKEFQFLRTNGHPYINTREKETIIKPGTIDEVINQLQAIKGNAQENEGLAWTEATFDDNEESIIVVTSYLFTISDIKKCESMANHYTKDSLWRLEHQPNSIQAKRLRALIDKQTANE